MGYELDLQRGADIQLTGSHSTALNTVDAYAVHLRYAEGDKKVFAKYSNKTVTGYEKRLFDDDLTTTPATFFMKILLAKTTLWRGGEKVDFLMYTQDANSDYDTDFKPVSGETWQPFGTTSKSVLETTDISP